MRDEHVELLEGALVEQHLDTLAGGVFPFFVLFVDRLLAAAHARGLAILDQPADLVLNFAHK